MEREQHRKRDDRGDAGARREDRDAPGRRTASPREAEEEADADTGEPEAGPRATAAAAGPSREDLEDKIKDSWESMKEDEVSIVRGLYDQLKEDKDAEKPRSGGFFRTLFDDLVVAGVSHLLTKASPSGVVAGVLTSVFGAAKAAVTESLTSHPSGQKILPSTFLETYVRRHINAAWLKGAHRFEDEMNKLDRKELRALHTRMRKLAEQTDRSGARLTDAVLDAWMAALNQEHKQQDPSNDFKTETTGRLHLTGVKLLPPSQDGRRKEWDERIHDLTAYLDGTGSIRNRLLERRLDDVQVPLTAAVHIESYGNVSFGIGPSGTVPTVGPMDPVQLALREYGEGKGQDWMAGIRKLWNVMKGRRLGDLVGNNKKGDPSNDIRAGDDD